MNEKISYLNVFFQHEEEPFSFLTSKVADHVPELIFAYHVGQRNIPYGNQKFCAFIGRTLNMLNASGVKLESLMHPEDMADVEAFFRSADKSGGHFGPRTVRLSDMNGRCYHHNLEGSVQQWNDAGTAEFVLFIAHDITDALKSKEEVETTRELLEETEELLQFGSWAWDVDANTVTWTSGLYSLLEYRPHEVDGKIDLDFYLDHVQEEYRQPFRDIIRNSLNARSDFAFEYVLRTHSGALKNISTRGKLVKNETGAVLKMLCINRDITALRSFEKEQERNIRELNRSNRDLEEFAYIASHDLQEPLRKISMFTERLKAKYENGLDKDAELFIDRILASAANMRTLIDNLLDFSRANRRSNTFDLVEIKSVLEGVVSELELKIEETKAEIRFCGSFPTIEAVKSEMTQLFSNILSNAIKFKKHDVAAAIDVVASKLVKSEKHFFGLPANQTFYKIEVKDNGIGFEQEYSEKIFQIFQRLNGKSEYPGSGIGLAICKKITEKHNGLIFAKSQPEAGAVFTIILPEKQF